jgi:beta-glucosidase
VKTLLCACGSFLEFQLGWFADPVFFGRWPASMVTNVGARLPAWSTEESELLKGSWDFFGLNHVR